LGIPPQRCLVFEDALLGVEAACRAGMKAIAITTTIPAKDFEGLCPVVEIAGDFMDLHPRHVVQLINERDS
jgi:beta-phosphoglucomutase-like phosphatase (HAD superfamily)